MRDEPQTADGARSAPDDPPGSDPASSSGDDFPLSDLERPPGYRGHSRTASDPLPERPEQTHRSDPYDYGATPSPPPSRRRSDRPAEPAPDLPAHRTAARPPSALPDDDDDGPVLDRALLARELAADRARGDNEPTADLPRTPSRRIPPHDRALRPDPDETGLDRLLPPGSGPSSAVAAAVKHRSGDVPATPFLPPAPNSSPATRFEKVLDASYRWRTVLGLGLAAVVTLGAVIAYRPGADEEATGTLASQPPATDSAIDRDTEFASTTAAGVDPAADQADQEVESAVGGRTTTVATRPSSATTGSDTSQRGSGGTATAPPAQSPPPSANQATTTTMATTTSTSTSSTSTTPAPDPVTVQVERGTVTAPAEVRSDATGFTGSGFVGNLLTTGAGVTVTVDSVSAGELSYSIRYATPAQPDGPRTLTLLLNGAPAGTVTFPQTADINTWSTVTGELDLEAMTYDVSLQVGSGDTGFVNIDAIQFGG